MSVICYSALNPTLGYLWPGCDIMQGGEPTTGSGPNETHKSHYSQWEKVRLLRVANHRVEQAPLSPSIPTPGTPSTPVLLFYQLANRWKDLLAKKVKEEKGMWARSEGRGANFSDRHIE